MVLFLGTLSADVLYFSNLHGDIFKGFKRCLANKRVKEICS